MSQKRTQKRKSTIADVALAAGVSKSTVSNYINNRHELFSNETGARIRHAISTLRYIPDPGARGIKSQEGGKSLGVLLRKRIEHATSSAYFQQVLPGICDTMDNYGYRTLVIPETRDPQRDITYIRELAKGLLAGFFIFNIEGANDPYVEALRLDHVNYVCFGYNPNVENFIASRHDLGVEAAVNHLVGKHGCRRIGIITESRAKNMDIDKMKGYRAALSANGLPVDPDLIGSFNDEDASVEEVRRILCPPSGERPDALLIQNLAVPHVKTVLAEQHLKIPRDLRLVLLEAPADESDNAYAFIRISTIQAGRAAAEKMFKLLKGHPDGPGGIFLDVDFHPGHSCGCS